MKETYKMTTKLITYSILLLSLVSCATTSSEPKVYQDEYGIIHLSEVPATRVLDVRITKESEIPLGCKRLRTIFIKGTYRKDWELKEAAAKMQGTHVTRRYVNNLHDTAGVAYDCTQQRVFTTAYERERAFMQRKAMEELERRRAVAGKGYELHDITVKDGAYNDPRSGLPVKVYRSGE